MVMNVGDLKKILEQYSDEMEILKYSCSDYALIDKDECLVIKGVPNNGWVMRSHPTMSEENKSKEKEYLLLA